ncbi:MAG: SUMF1/EgtB/PvdO family nonheme iron enzyme, partial [Muribaculaceae bacterium]|nr:SUMF1/EgtB/PvdO family nonheme iron enzyme [Muribaculaceae bacterium]
MKKITMIFVLVMMTAVSGFALTRGDINGDGAINVADVTALINRILGTASYADDVCDVDGNGTVNVSDVTSLVNIILGDNGSVTKSYTVGGVTFEMVSVDGGTFTMGGTSEQGSDADSDEKPTHQVTLSSYYIGKTEVTQALWEAVMGSNPSYWTDDNLPVEDVSWDDCQEFIRKLNALTGQTFRLPTEAEWEYAARGGNKSRGYKY